MRNRTDSPSITSKEAMDLSELSTTSLWHTLSDSTEEFNCYCRWCYLREGYFSRSLIQHSLLPFSVPLTYKLKQRLSNPVTFPLGYQQTQQVPALKFQLAKYTIGSNVVQLPSLFIPRLWQHVTSAINKGDQHKATQEKFVLEEEQRNAARERRESGTEWKPLLFQHDAGTNEWRYKYEEWVLGLGFPTGLAAWVPRDARRATDV